VELGAQHIGVLAGKYLYNNIICLTDIEKRLVGLQATHTALIFSPYTPALWP